MYIESSSLVKQMRIIIVLIFLLSIKTVVSQINQSFDVGSFLPAGWSQYHSGVNALIDTTNRFNSSTKSALFDDKPNVDSSWMILSQITSLESNSELTFWQNQNYGTYYVYHGVWISTGSNSPLSGNFIRLDSLGAGTEDVWEKKTIDLSSYSGQDIYIAFVYVGDFADEWYIDDIKVAPIGQINCTPPSNITSSNITHNSLKLTWTPIGGELTWAVEYGLAGFIPGTGFIINSSSPQITIPNLLPNTLYDHYIKANCGGNNSSFLSQVFTEKTTCLLTTNEMIIPYNEGFESVTEPTIPCGWEVVNNNNDTITWVTSSDSPKNGQNSAYISYADNASLSHNDWLFTPYYIVNDTSFNFNVGFSYLSKSGSAFPEKMEFYTAKANTGGYLNTLLFRDTAILTNSSYIDTSFRVKFSDTGKYYFGFHLFSDGDQWDFMIDDFHFDAINSTRVEEIKNKNKIKLFPNPTKNTTTLVSESKIKRVKVLSVSTVLIVDYQVNKSEFTIDLSGVNKGVYIMLIENETGVISKRVIKE